MGSAYFCHIMCTLPEARIFVPSQLMSPGYSSCVIANNGTLA
jgi:hypothetical protein